MAEILLIATVVILTILQEIRYVLLWREHEKLLQDFRFSLKQHSEDLETLIRMGVES